MIAISRTSAAARSPTDASVNEIGIPSGVRISRRARCSALGASGG
jgi:hypothetical protein